MNWKAKDTLKPMVKPEITRAQLQEYANASGDHNPIHLDEKFAKEAGFDSVIVHGMLSMAFTADLLTLNFPPSEYAVKKMSTRFRKVTFPGDVIRCEGEVKTVNEDGSLTVSFWTQNQKGENTTEGEAVISSKN